MGTSTSYKWMVGRIGDREVRRAGEVMEEVGPQMRKSSGVEGGVAEAEGEVSVDGDGDGVVSRAWVWGGRSLGLAKRRRCWRSRPPSSGMSFRMRLGGC